MAIITEEAEEGPRLTAAQILSETRKLGLASPRSRLRSSVRIAMLVEVVDTSALAAFVGEPLVLTRLSDLLGNSLEICDVDHGEALALALATRLTAYDASYLWLARQRSCDLVTLDRQLAQAAEELLPR